MAKTQQEITQDYLKRHDLKRHVIYIKKELVKKASESPLTWGQIVEKGLKND